MAMQPSYTPELLTPTDMLRPGARSREWFTLSHPRAIRGDAECTASLAGGSAGIGASRGELESPALVLHAPEAAHASAAPVTLSRGLAQVLNACVLDAEFCEAFLARPETAVRDAIASPGETLGCALPNPALQVPPLTLVEADWGVLRLLGAPMSLQALAERLVEISARRGSWPQTELDESYSHDAAPGVASDESGLCVIQRECPQGRLAVSRMSSVA